jgi:polyferredoxin
VYTEIFLWIEKKVEGDRSARMRLDQSAFSVQKFGKKWLKHALWIAFSLWTGFTFVGYFTPIRELAALSLAASLGPWQTFWVFFYGFATYGNAGFMREQVCKYMCPYARFQSAMFDRDTMIVTYDEKRGEPRGARSKKADPKRLAWGRVWIAPCAFRSAPPALTSEKACNTNASAVPRVSTCATP